VGGRVRHTVQKFMKNNLAASHQFWFFVTTKILVLLDFFVEPAVAGATTGSTVLSFFQFASIPFTTSTA
jgi:hypothetical protein